MHHRQSFLVCVFALVIGALSQGVDATRKAEAKPDEAFVKSYKIGKNFYGFCMFCHARDGKGTQLTKTTRMAPPLAGSKRVLGDERIVARIVLHGLSGKVDGVTYETPTVAMRPPPPMMAENDVIVAGLLTYIRSAWGNKAPMVTAETVKAIRAAEIKRKQPWTLEELAKKFAAKEKAKDEPGGEVEKETPPASGDAKKDDD